MGTSSFKSQNEYESLWAEQLEESHSYYVPEKYQLGILTHFLDQQDIEYVTEGRIFCYPIDILAINGDSTMAIELKSGKIVRGIEQASRNTDFVDHSFLAVWEEDIDSDLVEEVSNLSIGLMGIGNSVELISLPCKTGKQLCSKENVISTVKNHVRSDSSVQ
ncbi:hypothetical protein [Halorubrum sp. CSM-61]|uniref:hypothetical protein n=1 Tax=Halorubrum sp. CSM-61 TaxID=2485838 RepID=UPI000F4CB3A9|nr:hypothetical protein [Halorubrum sp. CSM-61]